MATKAGTYSIPPASVVVGGQTYKSQGLNIQVVASAGGNRSSQQYQQGGRRQRMQEESPRSQSTAISGSDLFMTATASRTKVYEQEAILVTYKVYSLVNLTQLDGKLPTLDGFQIQEIPLLLLMEEVGVCCPVVNTWLTIHSFLIMILIILLSLLAI